MDEKQIKSIKAKIIVLAAAIAVNLALTGVLLSKLSSIDEQMAQVQASVTAEAQQSAAAETQQSTTAETQQSVTAEAQQSVATETQESVTAEIQQEEATLRKYVLYIGTNDKDTYKQEIPYDQCLAMVTNICTNHTGGGTIAEATGFWKDETGAITSEMTIQCILEDIEEEEVYKICDEILEALNQNSILVEKQDVISEYYN
jgi:hypothetical protein